MEHPGIDVRTSQNYYPFMYVLPTGHIFNLIDRRSRMFTQDGEHTVHFQQSSSSSSSSNASPGEA
jgi:hypothetical protein